MTTRFTLLTRAFGRLGVANYQHDIEPEERADARTTLDGMMAEWEATGLYLAYTPSDGSDNDAEQMTTPGWADQAIWNNLALRLAPDFGKQPAGDLRRDAKRGLDLITAKTLPIPASRRANTVITGAGIRLGRGFRV